MYYKAFCCLILLFFLMTIYLTNALKFELSRMDPSVGPTQPVPKPCNITCPLCTHSCFEPCYNGSLKCYTNTSDLPLLLVPEVCRMEDIGELFMGLGCFKQFPKYTLSLRFFDLRSDDPCKTCHGNPCQNNGVCINVSNATKRDDKYECRCTNPFFGTFNTQILTTLIGISWAYIGLEYLY